MAKVTVSGTHQPIARGVILSTWVFATGLTCGTGSYGIPMAAPDYPDKTVSVRGPFVTGVTIQILGGNTATWTTATTKMFKLSCASGAELTFSTGRIRTILQNPRWIMPFMSARTGTKGAATVEIISQSTKR
jgi:hypothetical protein